MATWMESVIWSECCCVIFTRLNLQVLTFVFFFPIRFGHQKRHQEWFQRSYLASPESQSLRCDLIRYICCVTQQNIQVGARWFEFAQKPSRVRLLIAHNSSAFIPSFRAFLVGRWLVGFWPHAPPTSTHPTQNFLFSTIGFFTIQVRFAEQQVLGGSILIGILQYSFGPLSSIILNYECIFA